MDSSVIFGIGVDIVEVERIRRMIKKHPDSLKRIFTPAEIQYCESIKNTDSRFISYAQRFAAKEAVGKSLGTGLGKNVFFSEIEVASLENGKPAVRLSGRSKNFCDLHGIISIEVSLSGTKKTAIAFAVALKKVK